MIPVQRQEDLHLYWIPCSIRWRSSWKTSCEWENIKNNIVTCMILHLLEFQIQGHCRDSFQLGDSLPRHAHRCLVGDPARDLMALSAEERSGVRSKLAEGGFDFGWHVSSVNPWIVCVASLVGIFPRLHRLLWWTRFLLPWILPEQWPDLAQRLDTAVLQRDLASYHRRRFCCGRNFISCT